MMEGIRELFSQIARIFTWWVIVAPWEQAVRVRLGKYLQVLEAGIHLIIPFIDLIYRQSTRRRIVMTDMLTLTTKDRSIVSVAGQMGYCITDIRKLYQTLHHAEDTLVATVQSCIAEFIFTHELEDCRPENIAEFVVKESDFSENGIGEVTFFITNFAVARTYRLIMDRITDYNEGGVLETGKHDRE